MLRENIKSLRKPAMNYVLLLGEGVSFPPNFQLTHKKEKEKMNMVAIKINQLFVIF